jgi:hypothetical protein
MSSIEKRLYRAWKKKRGMRLTAQEVEMLMHRGLEYLQSEEQADLLDCKSLPISPGSRQIDSSPALPRPTSHREPE